MNKLFILISLITCSLVLSCEPKPENDSRENNNIKEEITLIESGAEEVKQLLNHLQSKEIQIGKTTSAELSILLALEDNDYYMNEKIDLEDHTLYLTFTISQQVVSKISYATLSNSTKDFSYIDNILVDNFGTPQYIGFLSNDSLLNNSLRKWSVDSLNVEYKTFSDLNSGYELIIQ